MKTLKERIEIETAYDNGEKLDFTILSGISGTWYALPGNEENIVFQWDMNDYRIKTEPLEFWVNANNFNFGRTTKFHKTKESAESAAVNDTLVRIIKVREVME